MKLFEIETQRKIYNLIEKNPGIKISRIIEDLKIPLPVAEHHIHEMEQDLLIKSVEINGERRYYTRRKGRNIREMRMHELKKAIYDIVSHNPGVHLSGIADMLSIRLSLVEYHVKQMETEGLIQSIYEKGYKRYFTGSRDIGEEEKKTLSLLRQEIPLKIVLYLLKNPVSKHGEIAEALGLTTPALSYHLNKLVEQGLVKPPTLDKPGYTLHNKKEILNLLRRYQFETVVERFTETWEDLT